MTKNEKNPELLSCRQMWVSVSDVKMRTAVTLFQTVSASPIDAYRLVFDEMSLNNHVFYLKRLQHYNCCVIGALISKLFTGKCEVS